MAIIISTSRFRCPPSKQGWFSLTYGYIKTTWFSILKKIYEVAFKLQAIYQMHSIAIAPAATISLSTPTH